MDVKGKTILGIAAHPDDLDFGCSGSVAKFVNEGAQVFYLILTDGSKGSEDKTITSEKLVDLRHKEQLDASRILGLKDVYFLDFIDGELENNATVRYEVVKIIRKLKPDIVITMDPTFIYDSERGIINHPDHRAAGQITLDCVFPFARNAKTFPDLLNENLESHHVKEILLVNIKEGNFYTDITKWMDKKLEALEKHVTQYENFKKLEERVRSRAEENGKKINKKYAEKFIRISISN